MNTGSVLGRIYVLLKLVPKTAALSVVGPVALLVFGYMAWTFWGAAVIDKSYYSLRMEQIRITPQPAWIQTDVLKEVFEGSFLKDISVLDRQATASVAQAFDMHPWIKQTHRVTKLDGGVVQVDLEYRKPIALVYLDADSPVIKTSRNLNHGGGQSSDLKSSLQQANSDNSSSSIRNPSSDSLDPYFLAVDHEGVLLPSKAPQSYRVQDFMMIYAKGASPTGAYGERFGDPRVHEAVKLCAILFPLRDRLELESIYVYQDRQQPGSAKYLLEVAQKPQDGEQRRFPWGHAPGSESPNEPPIEAKVAKMVQLFQTQSPLDSKRLDTGLRK